MPSVGASRSRTCCSAVGIGGMPSCCVIESALAASTRLISGMPLLQFLGLRVKSSAIASRAARSCVLQSLVGRQALLLALFVIGVQLLRAICSSSCRSRSSLLQPSLAPLELVGLCGDRGAELQPLLLRRPPVRSSPARSASVVRRYADERTRSGRRPPPRAAAPASAVARGCRRSQLASRSRSVSSFGWIDLAGEPAIERVERGERPASLRPSGLGFRRVAPTWPTSKPQFGQLPSRLRRPKRRQFARRTKDNALAPIRCSQCLRNGARCRHESQS